MEQDQRKLIAENLLESWKKNDRADIEGTMEVRKLRGQLSGMTPEQKTRIVRRTPMRRLGTTADVVGAVRFLLGKDANFITGQTFVVDGGLTC